MRVQLTLLMMVVVGCSSEPTHRTPTSTCGNGVVELAEVCDDGNTTSESACAYGTASCTTCNADCTAELALTGAYCGDGEVSDGEACDDGNVDATDGCLSDCSVLDLCAGFAVTTPGFTTACSVSPPSTLELAAAGSGFLRIGGADPVITVDGAPVVVAGFAGCGALASGPANTLACTSATVELPAGLTAGSHTVAVTLPTTAACSATVDFDVADPPTVVSVDPAQQCASAAAQTFTVSGTSMSAGMQVTLSGNIAADEVAMIDGTTLQATFYGLGAGTYDVTVTSAPGCEATLPSGLDVLAGPILFAAQPAVVFNAMGTPVELLVSDVNGAAVSEVGVRPTGTSTAFDALASVYDPAHPSHVAVVVPSGLTAGRYDVRFVDGAGCASELASAFVASGDTSVTVSAASPATVWEQEATVVQIAGDGFVDSPRVYLLPSGVAGAQAVALPAVEHVDATSLRVVVPAGLAVGDYDVVVVNPDGTVGLSGTGVLSVSASAPPAIDGMGPSALVAGAVQPAVVTGANFDASAIVQVLCESGSVPAVVLGTVTDTRIDFDISAEWLVAGDACAVRVINPDGAYDDSQSLPVIPTSGNLGGTQAASALVVARRAPAVAAAGPGTGERFVYALGGDAGATDSAMDGVEVAELDGFAELGPWRAMSQPLPAARTLAAAASVGRFVFVAGGLDATGAPLDTVLRAEVLTSDDAPAGVVASLGAGAAGPGVGLWYYRVAAVMGAGDGDNPSGESLPSAAVPVSIPASTATWPVELSWQPVAGAAGYRIYRTSTAGLAAAFVERIAEVPSTTASFVDTGSAGTSGEVPRRLGDLGVWVTMPAMAKPRAGFGLAVARDPSDASKSYLYAMAGISTDSALPATYEVLSLAADAGGSLTAGSWVEDLANPLPAGGRWQVGAFAADATVIAPLANATDTYIYCGPGMDAAGTGFVSDLDVALVQTGGLLGTFQVGLPATSGNVAGYAHAGMVNHLYIFGGGSGQPSTGGLAAPICTSAAPCAGGPPDPPDLVSWNSTGGASLIAARHLPGSVTVDGRLYIIGGATTGGAVAASVDRVGW